MLEWYCTIWYAPPICMVLVGYMYLVCTLLPMPIGYAWYLVQTPSRRGDIGTETHIGTLPAKINHQCISKLAANLFCHQSRLLRVGWYHPLPLTHVLQVL